MESEKRSIRAISRSLELGSIGFSIIDAVPDHDLAYTTFKNGPIEITIERGKWMCEITKGNEHIEMKGVNTREDVQTLIQLINGKESN